MTNAAQQTDADLVEADADLVEAHKIMDKTGFSVFLKDCTFKGDLVLNSSAKIDGTVEGAITINNNDAILYISPTGRIAGEVRAARIYIDGAVNGVVSGDEITVAGKFEGELHYKNNFIVKSGADVRGSIVRYDESETKPTQGRDRAIPHERSHERSNTNGGRRDNLPAAGMP